MPSTSFQIHGKTNYLADVSLYQREKPYELTIDLWHVPEQKTSNILVIEKNVIVRDMSNSLSDFHVDTHGFQALHYPTQFRNNEFRDASASSPKDRYYEECEQLLKTCFGATEVFIFDSQYRKSNAQLRTVELNEKHPVLRPADGVHIDQTPDSARRRVIQCLPDRADKLLSGRFQILNIWRPLVAPVTNHPLLLCDYRTTTPAQLVPADVISPSYHGEQYWMKESPDHQYWYYGNMSRDDVLIIKCFDSAAQTDETIAKFAPHGAFTFNDANPDSQPRESFEIRALVFSDL